MKRRSIIEIVAVAVVLLLLLAFFRMQKRQEGALNEKIEQLHAANKKLYNQIVEKNVAINNLEVEKEDYNDSLELLRADYARLHKEYTLLLREKREAIAVAQEVGGDESYRRLQAIYPDSAAQKPYPFTGNQVKSIYVTSIEFGYQSEQITLLEERLANSVLINTVSDSIMRTDSLIIQNYESMMLNYDSTLVNKDEEIVILGKRAKNSRIWKALTVVAGAIAAGVIIAN